MPSADTGEDYPALFSSAAVLEEPRRYQRLRGSKKEQKPLG